MNDVEDLIARLRRATDGAYPCIDEGMREAAAALEAARERIAFLEARRDDLHANNNRLLSQIRDLRLAASK